MFSALTTVNKCNTTSKCATTHPRANSKNASPCRNRTRDPRAEHQRPAHYTARVSWHPGIFSRANHTEIEMAMTNVPRCSFFPDRHCTGGRDPDAAFTVVHGAPPTPPRSVHQHGRWLMYSTSCSSTTRSTLATGESVERRPSRGAPSATSI